MSSFSSYESLVEALYVGYFERAGDPTGEQYWQSQLGTGALSFGGEASSFSVQLESEAAYPYLAGSGIGSPETVNGVATYSNIYNFINQVYQDLFNRSVDSAGLAYWSAQLFANQGNPATTGEFIVNVISGATTGGSDDLTLQAKVAVATFITNQVYSSGGTWTSALANESKALIAATTSSNVSTQEAAWTTFVSSNSPPGFTLTTGLDTINIGANGSVVVGTFGGAAPTYNTGDTINGGTTTGDTLQLADGGTGGSSPANPTVIVATVSNIATFNVVSSEAVTVNTASSPAGFSGLTQLNVTAAGTPGATATSTVVGNTIAAAATTNIALTDTFGGSYTATVASDTVNGGNNVVLTIGNVGSTSGAGTINVGQTTAAAGTVTVTENIASSLTGAVDASNIAVKGGTTIAITANLTETAGSGNTVTGGTITVTGNSATTSVSVAQTAKAAAANAVVAVTGVSSTVAAVTAAPGLTAVSAATQTTAVSAKAAVAGVVDGTVTIQDANYNTGAANSITSVTLANFGASSTINDNALTSLSLTGGVGTLTLTNATNGAGGVPTSNSTLALILGGVGSISGTSGSVTDVTFDDANGEVTTLNVTATSNSYVTIVDNHLSTLSVAGTSVLNLSAVPSTVKTIAISASAGFSDGSAPGTSGGLSGDAALTSFTTTSSGTITATLNDTTQSFVGSSGRDLITVSADATMAITGGSASNNEIVFNAAAATFNATASHLTNTNITGFSVFGLGASSSGTWNMATFNAAFNAIDITAANFSGNVSDTITNAPTGASISVDGTNSGVAAGSTYADTGTISVAYVDTTGATDTTNLTIGAALPADYTVTQIALADANGVGIGTVNIATLGSDVGNAGGALITIGTLVDQGLATLSVSGSAGLTINTLDETAHQATSITIDSTESGQNGTTIGTLTDSAMGSLTFGGAANAAVTTLVGGGTITSLTLANAGTGAVLVGALSGDTALANLTLTGNVGLGADSATEATAIGVTTGMTIAGASDNAHVNINLTGAASGDTDTITLGNGNDLVADQSAAGKVNVTVGTGANLIDLHVSVGSGATTLDTVTLGSHTGTVGSNATSDEIKVGETGVTSASSAPTAVISGAVAGDEIQFVDSGTSIATLSAANQSSVTAAASLSDALSIVEAASTTVAHSATAFTYGGNTYIYEAATTNAFSATDGFIELVGIHTLGTVASNVFTLAT